MDWEKSKDKWGDYPLSRNIVDLTGLTGPMHTRLKYLDNFLQALIKNRRSTPNQSYYSGLGDEHLAPAKDFPFRPAEGPDGNIVRDLITNPKYTRDQRFSAPEAGPLLDNLLGLNKPKKGSKTDKIKPRY